MSKFAPLVLFHEITGERAKEIDVPLPMLARKLEVLPKVRAHVIG
jgi:hypothetical protein